jgi:hypothetical protein
MTIDEMEYTRNEVDKAGDILRDLESSSLVDPWAASVLSYWRAIPCVFG